MMLSYSSVETSSILNVMLFMIPVSVIMSVISSLFDNKTNRIITLIIFGILGFWYNVYYVFNAIFDTQFSLAVIKLSDQGLKFAKSGFQEIVKHFYGVILMFLPLILSIIYRKIICYDKIKIRDVYIYISLLVMGIFIFIFNIYSDKDNKYGIYDLYHNINDNALNIEKLGVLNATFLDLDRSIRGFSENIISDVDVSVDTDNDIIDYGYNSLELNLDELLNSDDKDIVTLAKYISSSKATSKNEYTGLFEGKNLIYITAESFSEIAVSSELTPTLYKLVNSGFHFTNYYSSNNLSTIGGEFQSLTGLYASSDILSIWRSGKNSFPYGLSTIFKNVGYNTYAYHNHYATFQDRNKYLQAMGFDNYLACYNGLEKRMNCGYWPNSDVDMISATYDDYITSDSPFLAYYMTVSGHFQYNFTGNKMAKKNKDLVKDLPYSDAVKAYLATQIELDRALELLINKLEEYDKLDDTVIVLLCDHYPYGLSLDEINELSSYLRDGVVEVNSNSLIIWNNKIKHKDIDKVAMSIDVIPTVYNLFGLDYDSRLYMGSDIFSDSIGLAFFKNRSWVTDKGTYLSSKNSMISNNDLVDDDYINNINNIVSNRKNISKLIIKTDFYKYL